MPSTPPKDATQELISAVSDQLGQSEVWPALSLYRRDAPTPAEEFLMEPYLGVVVQGHKQVILGETIYSLDARHYLLTSLDLPLGMKVTQATPDCPYLGLTLKLDMARLTELALQLPSIPLPVSVSSLIFGSVSAQLVSALTRLVRLLESPKDLPFLAPLVEQELYYHLLTGPQGE